MQLDRDRARNAFAEYVSHYDAEDEKVKLKIYHTYRVAELCQRIAESEHFSKEDADIAWLSGLLHDVGRFEQLRMYNTFNDAESVDHGMLSASILFDDMKIHDYVPEIEEDIALLLRRIIEVHSAYRIPADFDSRTERFAHLLRDADKIDILKVNIETRIEDIYNITTQELVSCEVTPEVMESLEEGHCVLRSLKKVPVDHIVGHISLCFGLVYPISLSIVVEQGYLDKLIDFKSENEKTRAQFARIRTVMDAYVKHCLH